MTDLTRFEAGKALVEYLSTACAGTGQSTFYNTKAEQQAALDKLHKQIMQWNRRVYAVTAAFPVNDKNRQMIVENLMAYHDPRSDFDLEYHAIAYTVATLPFNRSLNMMIDLVKRRVNNARTRRLGRDLWDMADPYRVIKYRDKFRRILRHCHVPEGPDKAIAELHQWVFGKIKTAGQVQHNVKLRSRLQAPTQYKKCFDLPFDIARDIAVNMHGKGVAEFTAEYAEKTKSGKTGGGLTRKETLRARQTTKKSETVADTEVDFKRFDMIELLMHLYRYPDDYGSATIALEEKAKQISKTMMLPEKVAVVVDNSKSAQGSGQRAYHPLAVMDATLRALLAKDDLALSIHYVGKSPTKLLEASGASNLRMPLARALAERPDLVLILSDGYENVSAGSVSQIINSRVVLNSGIAITHLNPVAAAEAGSTRSLADGIPTFGLQGPAQLPVALLLGQATSNPELLMPVFDKVAGLLISGDYKAARLACSALALPAPAGGA